MRGLLAIDGGTPSRTKPLPSWPQFDEATIQAAIEPLREGRTNYWGGTRGLAFQERFARRVTQAVRWVILLRAISKTCSLTTWAMARKAAPSPALTTLVRRTTLRPIAPPPGTSASELSSCKFTVHPTLEPQYAQDIGRIVRKVAEHYAK